MEISCAFKIVFFCIPDMNFLCCSEIDLVSFPLHFDSKSALEAASSHLPLLVASLRSVKDNNLNDMAKRTLIEAANARGVDLEM